MFNGVNLSRLKVFLIFFRLKSSNGFQVKTHIFERFFIFVLLFVNMGH